MKEKLPSELLWIILAVVGGFAQYFNTYLKGKELFSIARMLATVFGCGFSGYMTAQFSLLVYPSWGDAALFSAGIGGYIGVEVLNLLIEFWKKKFNLEGKNGKNKK